jgi:hypothetical protein
MANTKSRRSGFGDPTQAVRAMSESMAEMFVGFNDMFGDFLSSMADRVTPRRDDEESETVTRGGRTRRRRHIGNVLRDSADIMSRSVDRFRDVYDDHEDGDEEAAPSTPFKPEGKSKDAPAVK